MNNTDKNVIIVTSHETKKELPAEVAKFFRELQLEHSQEIKAGIGDKQMLIESINIRVNLHSTYAIIESQTSSYDRSKHYLEQLLN